MTSGKYQPIDPARIATYSIAERAHKVDMATMAKLPPAGASAADLLSAMPCLLGAAELRAVAETIVSARRAKRPVVFALGAHVIKTGCSPIVIDLIRRGVVTAIACNGATAIHDVELATIGATSEEVADTIRDGSFGMVRETLDFFASVSELAARDNLGLGEAIGRLLIKRNAGTAEHSILGEAHRAGLPATVHVALGTDTVHMTGATDGAAVGRASMRDFRLLCSVVADLGASAQDGSGGMWLNIGSAVVLPEVFLKAVSVARNLGANLDAMNTGNFDMIRHYRPRANVVTRPVSPGRGHEVIGHHEILLPLLRQAIIEAIND